MMKKLKKKTFTKSYLKNVQNPDQTSQSHTVETTDKIVFSLCKLFTWYFEVKH